MRHLPLAIACLALNATFALAEIAVPMVYLEQEIEHPPTLSNLDIRPSDLGQAGAMLALKDNLTTGTFMGHNGINPVACIVAINRPKKRLRERHRINRPVANPTPKRRRTF